MANLGVGDLIALLTFFGVVVGGFAGAVWKLAKVMRRLEEGVKALDGVPRLLVDVDQLKEATTTLIRRVDSHIRTDHKELRGELKEARDIAMRASFQSVHDHEE